MTKFHEIVTTEYAKAKQLSIQRKQVKAELNAAYAKYKKFMAETYKPGRKAAFEAIAKAKAERKADVAAKKMTATVKKAPAKKLVKTITPVIKKAAVKKAAVKKTQSNVLANVEAAEVKYL